MRKRKSPRVSDGIVSATIPESAAAPAVVVPLIAAQGAVGGDDIVEMLYWGGGLVFAMLLLFVLQKAIRHGIESRVRSIHRKTGIDFTDVERMSQTGLLTEEEKARVKKAIAKTYSIEARETVEKNMAPEAWQGLEKTPHPGVPPAPPRPGGAQTRKTVDLEALLERGLITPEEYERLKSQ
jgi:hypothetical protein